MQFITLAGWLTVSAFVFAAAVVVMIIILFRHNIFLNASSRWIRQFDFVSLCAYFLNSSLSLCPDSCLACVSLHLKICWKIEWSHLIFNTCLHLKVKSNKKKNPATNAETALRWYFMSILIELTRTRIYSKMCYETKRQTHTHTHSLCVYKAKTSIPAVASLLSSWYFNNFVIWFTLNKLAVGCWRWLNCKMSIIVVIRLFVYFCFLDSLDNMDWST